MREDAKNLGSHLLATRSSDGVVYLDIAGDLYLCRYEPQASPWRREEDPLHEPTGRALPQVPGRIRPVFVLSFIRALRRTLLDFGRFDFSRLLAAVQRLPRPAAPNDPERLAHAAAAFERLCLLVPFPFLCLFRSYLLLHYLSYQRLGGTWIFGVSLFPFQAHCWVSDGEYLIGDRPERLENLSVIHAVGPSRR